MLVKTFKLSSQQQCIFSSSHEILRDGEKKHRELFNVLFVFNARWRAYCAFRIVSRTAASKSLQRINADGFLSSFPLNNPNRTFGGFPRYGRVFNDLTTNKPTDKYLNVQNTIHFSL